MNRLMQLKPTVRGYSMLKELFDHIHCKGMKKHSSYSMDYPITTQHQPHQQKAKSLPPKKEKQPESCFQKLVY